jgi:hypothetical protein
MPDHTHADAVIHRAMTFEMDEILQRYAKDEELPMASVREHERELKRYLALCALNPEGFYGMRGPIDQLWHTFVLFTRRYSAFCDDVAGDFIHHFPNVPRETPETRQGAPNIVEGYKRFLTDYETTFGEIPPAYLWPRPMLNETNQYAAAGCVCSCGCRCVAAEAS